MPDIESLIKAQYARFFEEHHWDVFKMVAEYYLGTAAHLKIKDLKIDTDHIPLLKKKSMITIRDYKLLIRNVQKRLFIGIGCELLLKAFYLKKGYCINKPRQKREFSANMPYRLTKINRDDFRRDDTYTMDPLIVNLKDVHRFAKHDMVVRGFNIAKVFRNKEGHIAVFGHKFDPSNYSDIEASLVAFYREAFLENLTIQFSMTGKDEGIFKIMRLS